MTAWLKINQLVSQLRYLLCHIPVLSLQSTVDFHFVQGHGQEKMSGSVSDVVITSAAFDEEKRKSTKSKVNYVLEYCSYPINVINL